MMNICIRLTLDTNDPAEAEKIVNAMMVKEHEGVIGWGRHRNNGECRMEGTNDRTKATRIQKQSK